MKKQIISGFLAILLALTMMPAISYAENNSISALSDTVDTDITAFAKPRPTILTDEQISNIEALCRVGLENINTEIDISAAKIPWDESSRQAAATILLNLIDDEPLYFHVSQSSGIGINGTYASDGSIIVQSFRVTYRDDFDTKAEYNARKNALLREADSVIAYMNSQGVTASSPDFDKALWIHDYIALNCEYDIPSYNAKSEKGHGADDAILDNAAVCQGYSAAYRLFMEKLGIECENVYDNTSNHEWSLIKINGYWYHVDITHDDPVTDKLGYVSHKFFLLTDEEIIGSASHSDDFFTTHNHIADGPSYDAHDWRNSRSSIAFVGSDRYYIVEFTTSGAYIQDYAKIVKCDSDMNVTNDSYYEFERQFWYNKNGGITNTYAGIGSLGNSLYFNTNKALYKIDTTDATVTPELVHQFTELSDADLKSSPDEQCYGSYVNRNILYYGKAEFVDFIMGTTSYSQVAATIFSDKQSLEISHLVSYVSAGSVVKEEYIDTNGFASSFTPINSDLSFGGWFTDPDFTDEFDFSAPVTCDIVLYAKWISYPYVINDLKLLSQTGTPLLAMPDGSSFIANITVTKTGVRDAKDFIFVAVYDDNNKLLSLDYVYANIPKDCDFEFGFSVPKQTDKIGEVRAFIWNTFGSLEPLAKSVSVN